MCVVIKTSYKSQYSLGILDMSRLLLPYLTLPVETTDRHVAEFDCGTWEWLCEDLFFGTILPADQSRGRCRPPV